MGRDFRTALILGGARSGKSAYAEKLALETGLSPLYIATLDIRSDDRGDEAQSLYRDEEMRERVEEHRRKRDSLWSLVEEPVNLQASLERHARPDRVILIDCLTLWLSNLVIDDSLDENSIMSSFLKALPACRCGALVLVSNEVGLGIVPDNRLARKFRDLTGVLHQKIADQAELVTLVVAGLPFNLKAP